MMGRSNQIDKVTVAGILEIRYFDRMMGTAVEMAGLIVECSGLQETDARHMDLLVAVGCMVDMVEFVHKNCPMALGYKEMHLR